MPSANNTTDTLHRFAVCFNYTLSLYSIIGKENGIFPMSSILVGKVEQNTETTSVNQPGR